MNQRIKVVLIFSLLLSSANAFPTGVRGSRITATAATCALAATTVLLFGVRPATMTKSTQKVPTAPWSYHNTGNPVDVVQQEDEINNTWDEFSEKAKKSSRKGRPQATRLGEIGGR